MSTRSSIAVKHGPWIKSIYCHWDGYPEHNGRILLEHYTSSKANNLVALGNLSSLQPRIDPNPDEEHSYASPVDDVCVFYARDRGEEDQEWSSHDSESDWIMHMRHCEYFYLMDDGVWYVSQGGEFRPLHEVVEELDQEKEHG